MGRVLPFIVCLLSAPALSATVLLPAEFREVVAGSQVIAHARVIEVRSEWVDGRRQIETVVTAEVISNLKGETGRTLSFKVPGGQIGRYRSLTIGAPQFRPGEEAVLFLNNAGEPGLQVFGLNQGVFRVRQDQISGRRVVVTPPLVGTSDTPQRVVRGAAARRPMELDAFGAQVRAAMASQQGGAR
jgi:hypothetical protein